MYSLAERNQFHHTADNTVHICKFLQDLCHSGPIHSPVQFTVLLDIPCDQVFLQHCGRQGSLDLGGGRNCNKEAVRSRDKCDCTVAL